MGYRFSKEELLRFADIFESAAQVLFAGLVIPPLFPGMFDINREYILVLGIFLTLACWFLSWLLTAEASKK